MDKTGTDPPDAAQVLVSYQVDTHPIYVIGSLNEGVTILSQQIRALNLAWALVESGTVPTKVKVGPRIRVAVVGGGFSGLTLAAALIEKKAAADITVFERCDTAIPLQQGSDSRWVHPHIYDWPDPGSESFSAALPIMNWTAGRASDVVVQVLEDWMKIARKDDRLRFFCNTRHLLISSDATDAPKVRIEWVGEPREPAEPSVPLRFEKPTGGREQFDLVVLAAGFGLEGGRFSYWRNEELAQPHLGHAARTYIVSGAGDGAMVDLFRIRIARFRQDRILSELFSGRRELIKRLQEIKAEASGPGIDLFSRLEELWKGDLGQDLGQMARGTTADLARRLRSDTRVILHVRQPSFSDVITNDKVSFQNRLLAFMLYSIGGFSPSTDKIKDLAKGHGVPGKRIIRRHGTAPSNVIKKILSGELYRFIEPAIQDETKLRQEEGPRWTGGYFNFHGTADSAATEDDGVKAQWRQEYLPTPTRAIAATFCSSLAGFLNRSHPGGRLRITLHRALALGTEVVLQQCCEYQGTQVSNESARRTFPSDNGTIGAAFTSKDIVITRPDASAESISLDMAALKLNNSSQQMSTAVQSIAAFPMISNYHERQGDQGQEVIGVVYIDSTQRNFFNKNRVSTLAGMIRQFMETLPSLEADHLANNCFWTGTTSSSATSPSQLPVLAALQRVSASAVVAASVKQINFDHTDFTEPADTDEKAGSSKTHELKSWPQFYQAIVAGTRTHELRRDDRNFSVGDRILLREYDPGTDAYTGDWCIAQITSITSAAAPCALSAIGLAPGFCILSIAVLP